MGKKVMGLTWTGYGRRTVYLTPPSILPHLSHLTDSLIDLNFYQTIQLINYVRSTIKHHPDTDISTLDFTNAPFEDEKYLAPVLEDDALLYSIDELADPDDPKDPLVQQREDDAQEAAGGGEGAGGKVVAGRALR